MQKLVATLCAFFAAGCGTYYPVQPKIGPYARMPEPVLAGDIVKCCGSGSLSQLLQQRLRVLQVLRAEAFGESGVDGGQQIAGLVLLALLPP